MAHSSNDTQAHLGNDFEKGAAADFNGYAASGTPLTLRGGMSKPIFVVSQVQSCNMSPLGLLGFGWTTALLSMYHTTKVEPGTTNLVWCFALGFGGLAQLLAGMWEAYRGKMFGATAFSSYGAFWLSLGIYGIINDSGLFTLEGPETKGLEAMLGLWSILTFLLFICTLALNAALATLFFLLGLTFALLSAGVQHETTDKAAGWIGVLTAATAFYIAFAELFNDTVKRDVLPLGQLTWLQNLLHSAAVPYDVQRTEARGFGTTGVEQRTIVPSQHLQAHDRGGNGTVEDTAGDQ